MRVLGIDPGIELTGFAVLDVEAGEQTLVEYGVIRTDRDLTHPQRLRVLGEDLQQLLDQHGPFDKAGVEELFFAKNVTTAMAVSQARGVILFTLAAHQCTIQEVKPVEVKQAIVGSGNAKKQDVQRTVQLLFQLDAPPQPDDAADAIAIASLVANQPHV